MAYRNITGTAAVQVKTGAVYHVQITVNTGFTGTITVLDGTAAASTAVALVTNPAVGQMFNYWNLQNGLLVTSSATGDITVNYQANNQPR